VASKHLLLFCIGPSAKKTQIMSYVTTQNTSAHEQITTKSIFCRITVVKLEVKQGTNRLVLMMENERIFTYNFYQFRAGSRDSVVGIASKLRAGRYRTRIPAGTKYLSLLPNRPDRLWDSPSILLTEYWGSLPGVQQQGYLVPRLMSGAIPLLPL
jgi:hypothetical protein